MKFLTQEEIAEYFRKRHESLEAQYKPFSTLVSTFDFPVRPLPCRGSSLSSNAFSIRFNECVGDLARARELCSGE